MWINSQTDLISKVLSPAVGLWLRSLLDQVDELSIKIQGHDRQILKGYIPRVSLGSRQAIYQGLSLTEVEVKGENIRMNIGQILRGKPFRLLEPIRVIGKLRLREDDINSSLSSEVLVNAFKDLLVNLLERNNIPNPKEILSQYQMEWQEVNLHDAQFSLKGMIIDQDNQAFPLVISAGLELIDSHTLHIKPKDIKLFPQETHLSLEAFKIDLGYDVEIENLSLDQGQLACWGQVVIQN